MTGSQGNDLERLAAGLVGIQRAWAAFVVNPPPWVHETAAVIRGLSQAAERAAPKISAALEALRPFAEAVQTLERETAKADLLDAAGWLPHATSPFHLVDRTMEVAEVGAVAEAHYRDHWNVVQEALLARVAAHGVDEEAQVTFREAVQAHGHGLYRVAPRLLFPELERVVRRELLRREFGGGASLKELFRQMSGLSLSEVLPDGWVYHALFGRLAEHLYEDVKSLEQLEKVRSDPVPNRHAAVHGLVTYATAQTSLNALIMAEYVLGLVAVLKTLPPENT
ncbi:hypothetical protein [Roseomonas sp. BN140053]|uniref:hypothetical protein n=1 Tax=Roseomonas sp. BN140053 TaxID=3391898 RepID=UPI0039E7F129